jgi:tRNA(fMet)-specific endonuclease VapC
LYLLDTNILSELVRKTPRASLIDALRRTAPEMLSTSCICAMELRHGAMRTNSPGGLWSRIESQILARLTVLDIRTEDAILAGDVLAHLWSVGKPIETEDVLIGASALSRGLTVVTHNVNRFRRIPGLKVEDWLTS